jgi:hypothetical protein
VDSGTRSQFPSLLPQIVSQDQHVGSELSAAAFVLGSLIPGIIWGSLLVRWRLVVDIKMDIADLACQLQCLFHQRVMLHSKHLTTKTFCLQLMLAHAPDVAYTTFATLFAAMGFVPLAAMRAQLGPRGLLLCMGFTFSVSTQVAAYVIASIIEYSRGLRNSKAMSCVTGITRTEVLTSAYAVR